MTLVAIDTSDLVGLVDYHDKWHPVAVAIRNALVQAQAEVYRP